MSDWSKTFSLKIGHSSPHIVACRYNLYPANLFDICLIYGRATKLVPQKQRNKQKISAVELGSEHDNTMYKMKRQPSTGQMNILANLNYFYTEINTIHKFLFMCNVCLHVTCTVITVHAIFKGLDSPYQQVKCFQW